MSKSKARFLAELLSSDGKVIKAKSEASTIIVGDLPTIPNSKLANSSVTIAGGGVSLGASLTLDTGDITEHTNYKYYTDARAITAVSGSDLDMSGRKVLFGNVYSGTGDLPSASTYHGMFAHVHGTGKGYFAHAGSWVELANQGDLTTATTTANAALPKAGGAMTGAITTNSTFDGVDIATRDAVLTSTTTTANAALPKAGGTMTGTLAMGTNAITSTGTISSGTQTIFETSSSLLGLNLVGNVGSANQNSSSPKVRFNGEYQVNGPFIQAVNSAAYGLKTLNFNTKRSANDYTTLPTTTLALYSSGNVNVVSGALEIGGTTVIDASRNLTSIGNITTAGSTSIQTAGTNTNMTIGTSVSGSTGLLKLISTGDIQLYQYGSSWSTNVTFKGDGNVGIGTTNPAQNFVVAAATNGIGIELVPGTLNYIQAYNRGTSDYGDLKIDAQTIRFGLDNGAEKVRIDSSGNVGIGTDDPTVELDVYGDGSGVSVGRPWGNDSYVSSGYFGKQANAAAGSGWAAGSAFMKIEDSLTTGVRKGTSIDFVTHNYGVSNQTTMSLTASGNVGIGTTDPQHKLDVEGGSNVFDLARFGSSASDNSEVTIGYFDANANNGIPALITASDFGGLIQGGEHGHLVLGIRDNDATDALDIVSGGGNFMTDSTYDTLVATFKANGNVGIGTTTPNVKLAVDGQLSTGDRRLSLGILDLNSGTTPTQFKIITNIPFASGSADFTVNIKGFRYGTNDMVDLSIGWHYYNSTFYNSSVKSSGSYAPIVTLGVENSKVVIHLASPGYWPKLYVESLYSSAYRDSYAAGWSWADSAISSDSGTPQVSPAYSSNFGNNFLMLDNGNVGIGETSPGQKLHVNGNIRADGHYYVGGQIVIDSSRNLTNIASIDLPNANNWSYIKNNTASGGLRFGTKNAAGTYSDQIEISATGNYVKLNRNTTVSGTISSGAITAPSIRASSGAFYINRGSDGTQAIRVDADGVVIIPTNYFYVSASQGSYFSSAVRFRGTITNDTGTNVTFGQPINVTGDIKVGGTSVIESNRNLSNVVTATVNSLHIRGENNTGYSSPGSMTGGLSLWAAGATTSQMMFKPIGSGSLGNHGFCTDAYNTYFVMDTTNRGWVFRNHSTATNVASISNTGGIAGVTVRASNAFQIGTTTVIDASRNITAGTISSGNISVTSSSTSAIYVNGNNAGLYFAGGNNRIYFTGKRALEGNSAGTNLQLGEHYSTVNIQAAAVVHGNLTPSADNGYDLGSSSMVWRDLYIGDLNLNNETRKNDDGTTGNEIDGTTGNWTVQEGEEHLYLINNKNGKKYKFALEEIE